MLISITHGRKKREEKKNPANIWVIYFQEIKLEART
jgi:hypothetical protein